MGGLRLNISQKLKLVYTHIYQVLPVVTFLGIFCDLFRAKVGDLHLGDQKVTNGRSWYMHIYIHSIYAAIAQDIVSFSSCRRALFLPSPSFLVGKISFSIELRAEFWIREGPKKERVVFFIQVTVNHEMLGKPNENPQNPQPWTRTNGWFQVNV